MSSIPASSTSRTSETSRFNRSMTCSGILASLPQPACQDEIIEAVRMTQGTLAEHVGIHVSQLRRYEGGSSSPTLDVLRKLAIAPSVSADTLVFDAERNPDEELRLQLEATQRLTDHDRELVKRFINGLLLSHEAKRLAA